MNPFEKRDEIRTRFAADLLSGSGIEIGAGAFPQALPPGATASYYDLRTDEEVEALFDSRVVASRPMAAISSDFPDGADFLIAHNVLEHSPNPIATLIEWNSYLRPGGIVLISLPHFRYCPDARRRLPTLDHLLQDFLDQADGADFNSREHLASFSLGWAADFPAHNEGETVEAFARRLLDQLHGHGHDVHWHALDTELSLQIVSAAAAFGGSKLSEVRYWCPERGETIGDILIAYQVAGVAETGKQVQDLLSKHAARGDALRLFREGIERDAPALEPRDRLWAPLQRPFRQEDRCFVTPLPPEFLSWVRPGCALTVLEDGRPLGPPDSLHDDIRRAGAGAFSFWGSSLYFSASDSSDCNLNGRTYTAEISFREP